jgi:hypothetical protein
VRRRLYLLDINSAGLQLDDFSYSYVNHLCRKRMEMVNWSYDNHLGLF